MPKEDLPPNPDALEKWKNMPQNKPSRQAMPPATGGMRWAWALLIVLIVLAVIGLLSQGLPA
jgi:hypothetical protein